MNTRIGRRSFVASGICSVMPQLAVASGPIHSPSEEKKNSRDAGGLSSRLASYLLAQQQPDGSWKSETYGVLRSGQAMTPWVLHALIQSGQLDNDSHSAQLAVDWIVRQLRSGKLGYSDPDVLEYPVYATSLALRSLVHIGSGDADFEREYEHPRTAMIGYLLNEQFTEQRGFSVNSLAFGGWGFGGEQPPGVTGHMDLAHTRLALQALAEAGADPSQFGPSAERLLGLLQKQPSDERQQPLGVNELSQTPLYDGGFYFSPIVLRANKGRVERTGKRRYFRSYATATCDGLLSLLALRVATDDPRVAAAKRWLVAHPNWNYPDGIPRDYPEPWGAAVYFYHQAVRACAYRQAGIGMTAESDRNVPGVSNWERELVQRLSAKVRPDGSVVNDQCALMKEDDPLLCTSLALIAAGGR